MATELPVRIEFSLPDGWKPVQPDEAGAPEAAFVALHPPERDGFTPSITIVGELRSDDATLDTIADESVHRLERAVGTTWVRNRVEKGDADARSLTQVLDILSGKENTPAELAQCQVFLTMHDVHEPAKRCVLQLVLTCTADRLDDEAGDFKEFVRTVRPTGDSVHNPREPRLPKPRHTDSSNGSARGGGES